MNVMAQAHKMTKLAFERSSCGLSEKMTYREVFSRALKAAHKEYKAMQLTTEAQLLKADTIAKFEKRIEELSAILKGPDAQKYMVVVGDSHPMPVNINAENPKWPWTNVEGATKWDTRQGAEFNAHKLVNGNNEVGKAVRVDHHCEWDMQNLCKLINDLNAAK